jgi:hypothetical protein
MRTIIIGDVHGCIDELNDLLTLAEVNKKKDRIVFIGDLVAKGPDSGAVYARYRKLGAQSVLGNHEFKLLQALDRKNGASGFVSQLKKSLGKKFDDFVEDVREWPAWIETEEALAVHAGLVPGKAAAKTSVSDLVNIRTWDGVGKDLQSPDNPPWFEFYKKKKLVVFGHWARLGGVVRDNVVGLDTGCVYGGKLSAIILPGRDIVSVPARKIYAKVGG